MSDLRTRIAAALDKALPVSAGDLGFYQRLGETPLVDIEAYDLNLNMLADAVIAELVLKEERFVLHSQKCTLTNGGCDETPRIRYVTDWKAVDE